MSSQTGRIRILAVDDEPDILAIYQQILCDMGNADSEETLLDDLERKLFTTEQAKEPSPVYELATCNQGDKAIALTEQAMRDNDPFAIAFVDVRMPPGPDGITTASKLRELDRDLEIVIVTGFSDYSPAEIARSIPPPHKLLYVQKPFHATELLHFASSLGAKWNYSRELRRSEERFRHIVQDQTELILRFGMDGRITFSNDAARAFFPALAGSEGERISLHSLGSETAKDMEQAVAGLTAGSPVLTMDGRHHSPLGDEHWLTWTVRLLSSSQDGTAFQAVGRDVSEVRKAHSVLDSILQSIPDAMLTVDMDKHVLMANESMQSFCAAGSCLIPGKEVAQSCHTACECMKALEKTLASCEGVRNLRGACRGGDGLDRVVSITTAPLRNPDDHCAGAILIIRDITRYAEMERRLSERRGFRGLLGESPPMLKVFSLIEQLADLDTTVLITGESGTGKELVAEALHFASKRSASPMVKVNCSALTETLLESELFGHVKGAFTGAIRDMPGRFKAASNGTIFLDEIGDVSHTIQLKLLRVLEQKEYERVGDVRTIKSDARVVAATNADLKDKVANEEFREDLYYRLSVVTINIPPLRKRGDDVRLLTGHFFDKYCGELKKPILGIADEAMDVILAHNWPGNVRELKHAVEHACIMCNEDYLLPEHLPQDIFRPSAPQAVEQAQPGQGFDFARHDIEQAIAAAKGNKTRAAELLGVSRVTLYRHMAKLGIE